MATHVVGAMAAILRKHRRQIPPQLVIDVADFFERNNPSFDRARFIRDVADQGPARRGAHREEDETDG